MQRVTRATSFAAVAVVTTSMLMQTASAVEVTPSYAPEGTGEPVANVEEVTAPPPSSPNCFILGSRSFSIPFSVDTAGTHPVEVHLFVARGPNQDWQLLDRKRPDSPQKQFQFQADTDGEFWFATRTVDTLGRSHPAGEIESQLKVYVDTTKPRASLDADADPDGHVDVTLSVHDATELKEVQLRYVTDTTKQWVNVDLGDLSADGRLRFVPNDADSWKQISVQLVVTDTPGNRSVVNQLLRRPRLADADTSRYAASQDRSGTEAKALPYRIESGDRTSAYTVSNPVIQLDRHQPPPPPSDVTTAHGYAADSLPQQRTPFYGFRGASTPLPSASPAGNALGAGPAPQFFPAPQPGLSPQVTGSYSPASPTAAAPPFQQAAPMTGAMTGGSPYAAGATAAADPATVPGYAVPYGSPAGAAAGGLPSYGVIPQQGSQSGVANIPPSSAAPAPSYARPQAASPAPVLPQTAAVPSGPVNPSAGSSTPRPASLFEKLFGTAPPPQSPTPSEQTGSAAGMTFGPPSVRGSRVQSRLAATAQEGLPPMATADQISDGFELNSPNGNSAYPSGPGQPSSAGSANGSEPETIPLPSNPEPSSPTAPAPPQRPRPRTPAEAMKPIDAPSEVSSLLQEEVPTPAGEPAPYQSQRATLGPNTRGPGASGPQRNELSNMMDRAPVRYSDSQRFSLEYELEAVGIQGTEAIELYGSTDGGRHWELWGRDPDRTSPFDIETKEAGVFGFRIVVVGRNGLASPRPQSGEAPDIVVVVDTDRPSVRITGASYGQGDRVGALIIQYECDDLHLKSRPIALSFSDSREGPWTTIAAGLRNEGQYIWKADPHLPRQFFLRIDATDEAGNAGSYILDQPIDSQGLAPRAKIRGFQTISGDFWNPSESGQTATRPQGTFK